MASSTSDCVRHDPQTWGEKSGGWKDIRLHKENQDVGRPLRDITVSQQIQGGGVGINEEWVGPLKLHGCQRVPVENGVIIMTLRI